MALLTTFCEECDWLGLEEEARLRQAGFSCRQCHGRAGVVPGVSFAAADQALFEDLQRVVAERTIPPPEAKSLAGDIASVLRTGADSTLLERLTSRLPGLLPIQIAAGANPSARKRALMLLRAIFEAKALKRRETAAPGRPVA